MKKTTKLLIGLSILALLTPLGMLAKNPAWGEWSIDELRRNLGFVPEGLAGLQGLWRAPMAGYGRPMLSALVGVAVILAIAGMLGWILSRDFGGPARTRPSFIRKTLSAIEDLFAELFLAQTSAEAPGLLQRLDPRMKIVTLMAGLVVTTFVRHGRALIFLYGITLGLALASRLPMKRYLARTWFFIPVFTFVMVFPLFFKAGGAPLAATLVLRTATAISWSLLLVLTTRWDRLLRALQSLGIPTVFLMVLTMTLRSLQILVRDLREMHWALESRLLRPVDADPGQHIAASHAAILFRKSVYGAQETYQAMLARGYSGRAVLSELWQLGLADFLWAGASLAGLAAVGWWGR